MNKKSINKKSLLKFVLLYGGLVVFLMSTDPTELSLPLLLIPFVWLGICIYATISYSLGIVNTRIRRISKSRRNSLAFTLAVVPICLLLLKSIGQLTVRDVLILLGLVSIGMFYASRMKVT